MEKAEELQEQTVKDIRSIINLVGKKPEKITIFVAPDWKYRVYETALANKENPKRIISAVMQDPEVRKHGKEGAKFAQGRAKNIGKLEPVLEREYELDALKEYVEDFKKEFECEVEVIEAEKSDNPKARQAAPGKPAIFVE
jgi:leucyl-tRNA synthetase